MTNMALWLYNFWTLTKHTEIGGLNKRCYIRVESQSTSIKSSVGTVLANNKIGIATNTYNTREHADYRIQKYFFVLALRIIYTSYSTCVDLCLGKKAKLFEYAKGLPPGVAGV